jgi:hypothetical protein
MNTQKMTLEDARNNIVRYCSSSTKLPTLLYTLRQGMALHDWRTLLGEVWANFDNVSQYRTDLKRAIFPTGTPHTCQEMMTQRERDTLAALPERVTLYRGCGQKNIVGCCWSLDRGTATLFPTLFGYRQENPLLVIATVRRDRIVALKLERSEQEIITFSARRVSVEPLAVEKVA